MMDQDTDSGRELVLDNRKLIIAFAIFIAICGCFFVLGFIEGKRQGYQEGSQTASESVPKASPVAAQVNEPKPSSPDTGAKPPEGSDTQLNWYKDVNRKAGEPEIKSREDTSVPVKKTVEPEPVAAPPVKTKPQAAAASPAKKTVEPAPIVKTKPQAAAAHSGPITYSVQVGAFSQRQESENRAKVLRSKGYDCRIESPSSSNHLFLVKVGRFHSRAEAVAMQLRLKRNGFTSFVKTN